MTREATAATASMMRYTATTICRTLSYCAAPMFCPTMDAPAVFTELDIMLTDMLILLATPAKAETATPKELTQELTNILENCTAAFLIAMGTPSFSRDRSISFSGRKNCPKVSDK